MKKLKINSLIALLGLSQFNVSHAQEFFNESSPTSVKSLRGGATWTSNNGGFVYNSNGRNFRNRALLYSDRAYQSDDGFVINFEYTTGTVDGSGAHNLSFGLISSETNLANYTGFNPFESDESIYSIGVNVVADESSSGQGINFNNGSEVTFLDQSGTRAQFGAGEKVKVTIEIGIGGSWTYRINDVYEDSGVIAAGIDLNKSYHVAVYGQDDNGGGKSIQSISLRKNYAAGERAEKLRGTWSSGIPISFIDTLIDADFKTLDDVGIAFTEGASLSAQHFAPHRLLESLSAGQDEVPAWGDRNSSAPLNDAFLEDILKAKEAGFKIKAYTNSEGFVGSNQNHLEQFATNFKNWCDTNREAQAFVNSQAYHTGIWNGSRYVDASNSHPNRKYMFCYAEFVLKDYAIRYGPYFESWIFDAGNTMENFGGDNPTSGVIEEQRIYQAYANAVHAGNPETPIAFNNGRSNFRYNSYPFAHPVRFDDFTFGHAFGGNNNHAEKVNGNQFNLNYQHITRMTETNAFVHEGGSWDWDDKIVGNFHSKVSTTAWKYGPRQAWEQDDFNQWNLEALRAGGHMTWDGSYNRGGTAIYEWVIPLLKGMDDYLYENGVSINNEAENSVILTKRNATGYSLDGGIGGADGQNVHLWSTNRNNVNQQWNEINRGGGYFSYVKSNTNFSIDGGRGGEREQNVYIWSTSANNFNQHWRKVRISGNAYRLEKRNAIGYSIDGGREGARGQNVHLWSNGSTNQNMQWIIE